jgi:hypothetical protein
MAVISGQHLESIIYPEKMILTMYAQAIPGDLSVEITKDGMKP